MRPWLSLHRSLAAKLLTAAQSVVPSTTDVRIDVEVAPTGGPS